MSGIGAITPQVMPAQNALSAAVASAEGGDVQAQSGGVTSTITVDLHAALSGSGKSAGAGGAAETNNSDDAPAIKLLKALIERLQKQLQELKTQLQAAQARAAKDESAREQVVSLQSQIASISGALSEAYERLSEALLEEGQGSSGALIDTTA